MTDGGGFTRESIAVAAGDPSLDEEEEMLGFLERDQLVAGTSVPVPRVHLGPRLSAALWVLRAFVIVVSAMVVYAFIDQLG